MEDHIKAHEFSSNHMDKLKNDKVCGCFCCLAIYSPSKIKEWIFVVEGCKYDIKETYKEINERYIREASKWPLSSTKRGVAISLQTNSLIGHFVYSLAKWIKSILRVG